MDAREGVCVCACACRYLWSVKTNMTFTLKNLTEAMPVVALVSGAMGYLCIYVCALVDGL